MSTTTAAPVTVRVPLDPELDDLSTQLAFDRRVAAMERQAASKLGGDDDARLLNVAQLLAEAAGRNLLTGEVRYTRDDVLGWLARAEEMGCVRPRIGPVAIRKVARLESVPNARVRAEYDRRVEAGETGLAARLAVALDADRGGTPDATYVERLLGVVPVPQRDGQDPSLRIFMTYEQAVILADALGIDYHDLGV